MLQLIVRILLLLKTEIKNVFFFYFSSTYSHRCVTFIILFSEILEVEKKIVGNILDKDLTCSICLDTFKKVRYEFTFIICQWCRIASGNRNYATYQFDGVHNIIHNILWTVKCTNHYILFPFMYFYLEGNVDTVIKSNYLLIGILIYTAVVTCM